jgi:hypothetical protein
MKSTCILGAALASVALLALAPAAKAATYPDLTYNVTLNLANLNTLNPNGPFSLDLQLVQGSGNVANTVTLSSFVFTGGTTTGTASTYGGVTGSLSSSLVLSSTAGGSLDNEIYQAFTSGVTAISFHVDQTPNAEVVGSGTAIPDQFNVAVLDSNLYNVPTTDPSGGNTLVNSDLAPITTVNQFSVAAAPEPSSMALSCIVALGMLGMVLRRRSRIG